MPFVHGALLFIAAFFAGMVNSIAGGGTLLTFPLLIWLGLDPKVANATSTVALWPGLVGGMLGYRRELEDSRTILTRLGITSFIGGAVGAWLLIATPSPTFARLVPFLILFATILFMLQGPVNRWLRLPSPTTGSQRSWWTSCGTSCAFCSTRLCRDSRPRLSAERSSARFCWMQGTGS